MDSKETDAKPASTNIFDAMRLMFEEQSNEKKVASTSVQPKASTSASAQNTDGKSLVQKIANKNLFGDKSRFNFIKGAIRANSPTIKTFASKSETATAAGNDKDKVCETEQESNDNYESKKAVKLSISALGEFTNSLSSFSHKTKKNLTKPTTSNDSATTQLRTIADVCDNDISDVDLDDFMIVDATSDSDSETILEQPDQVKSPEKLDISDFEIDNHNHLMNSQSISSNPKPKSLKQGHDRTPNINKASEFKSKKDGSFATSTPKPSSHLLASTSKRSNKDYSVEVVSIDSNDSNSNQSSTSIICPSLDDSLEDYHSTDERMDFSPANSVCSVEVLKDENSDAASLSPDDEYSDVSVVGELSTGNELSSEDEVYSNISEEHPEYSDISDYSEISEDEEELNKYGETMKKTSAKSARSSNIRENPTNSDLATAFPKVTKEAISEFLQQIIADVNKDKIPEKHRRHRRKTAEDSLRIDKRVRQQKSSKPRNNEEMIAQKTKDKLERRRNKPDSPELITESIDQSKPDSLRKRRRNKPDFSELSTEPMDQSEPDNLRRRRRNKPDFPELSTEPIDQSKPDSLRRRRRNKPDFPELSTEPMDQSEPDDIRPRFKKPDDLRNLLRKEADFREKEPDLRVMLQNSKKLEEIDNNVILETATLPDADCRRVKIVVEDVISKCDQPQKVIKPRHVKVSPKKLDLRQKLTAQKTNECGKLINDPLSACKKLSKIAKISITKTANLINDPLSSVKTIQESVVKDLKPLQSSRKHLSDEKTSVPAKQIRPISFKSDQKKSEPVVKRTRQLSAGEDLDKTGKMLLKTNTSKPQEVKTEVVKSKIQNANVSDSVDLDSKMQIASVARSVNLDSKMQNASVSDSIDLEFQDDTNELMDDMIILDEAESSHSESDEEQQFEVIDSCLDVDEDDDADLQDQQNDDDEDLPDQQNDENDKNLSDQQNDDDSEDDCLDDRLSNAVVIDEVLNDNDSDTDPSQEVADKTKSSLSVDLSDRESPQESIVKTAISLSSYLSEIAMKSNTGTVSKTTDENIDQKSSSIDKGIESKTTNSYDESTIMTSKLSESISQTESSNTANDASEHSDKGLDVSSCLVVDEDCDNSNPEISFSNTSQNKFDSEDKKSESANSNLEISFSNISQNKYEDEKNSRSANSSLEISSLNISQDKTNCEEDKKGESGDGSNIDITFSSVSRNKFDTEDEKRSESPKSNPEISFSNTSQNKIEISSSDLNTSNLTLMDASCELKLDSSQSLLSIQDTSLNLSNCSSSEFENSVSVKATKLLTTDSDTSQSSLHVKNRNKTETKTVLDEASGKIQNTCEKDSNKSFSDKTYIESKNKTLQSVDSSLKSLSVSDETFNQTSENTNSDISKSFSDETNVESKNKTPQSVDQDTHSESNSSRSEQLNKTCDESFPQMSENTNSDSVSSVSVDKNSSIDSNVSDSLIIDENSQSVDDAKVPSFVNAASEQGTKILENPEHLNNSNIGNHSTDDSSSAKDKTHDKQTQITATQIQPQANSLNVPTNTFGDIKHAAKSQDEAVVLNENDGLFYNDDGTCAERYTTGSDVELEQYLSGKDPPPNTEFEDKLKHSTILKNLVDSPNINAIQSIFNLQPRSSVTSSSVTTTPSSSSSIKTTPSVTTISSSSSPSIITTAAGSSPMKTSPSVTATASSSSPIKTIQPKQTTTYPNTVVITLKKCITKDGSPVTQTFIASPSLAQSLTSNGVPNALKCQNFITSPVISNTSVSSHLNQVSSVLSKSSAPKVSKPSNKFKTMQVIRVLPPKSYRGSDGGHNIHMQATRSLLKPINPENVETNVTVHVPQSAVPVQNRIPSHSESSTILKTTTSSWVKIATSKPITVPNLSLLTEDLQNTNFDPSTSLESLNSVPNIEIAGLPECATQNNLSSLDYKTFQTHGQSSLKPLEDSEIIQKSVDNVPKNALDEQQSSNCSTCEFTKKISPNQQRNDFQGKFLVGKVEGSYICFKCKAKFSDDKLFRCHLWYHIHLLSASCTTCDATNQTAPCEATDRLLNTISNLKNDQIFFVLNKKYNCDSTANLKSLSKASDELDSTSVAGLCDSCVTLNDQGSIDNTPPPAPQMSMASPPLALQTSMASQVSVASQMSTAPQVYVALPQLAPQVYMAPSPSLTSQVSMAPQVSMASPSLASQVSMAPQVSMASPPPALQGSIAPQVSMASTSPAPQMSMASPPLEQTSTTNGVPNVLRCQNLVTSPITSPIKSNGYISSYLDYVSSVTPSVTENPTTREAINEHENDGFMGIKILNSFSLSTDQMELINKDADDQLLEKSVDAVSETFNMKHVPDRSISPTCNESIQGNFFKCSMCDFASLLASKFKQHIVDEHIESIKRSISFKCFYCDFETLEIKNYVGHYNEHALMVKKDYIFSCGYPDCNTKHNHYSEHIQHCATHLNWKPVCSQCNSTFETISDLAEHCKRYLVSLFSCSYCKAKTVDRKTLLEHVSETHAKKARMVAVQKILTCNVDLTSENDTYIIEKLSTKSPMKTGAAPIAASETSPPSNCFSTFLCQKCSFVCNEKREFLIHKKVHMLSSNSLLRMMNLPFSCPVCPDAYVNMNQLLAHLDYHDEDVTLHVYKCPIDSFETTDQVKRKEHCRYHADRTIFKHITMVRKSSIHHCDLCNIKVKDEEIFRRHLFVHGIDGEKVAMDFTASKFSPPVSTFSPSVSTFSPSVSTFSPSVSTFSPSVSTFSPPVTTFSPIVSTFSPSVSTSPSKIVIKLSPSSNTNNAPVKLCLITDPSPSTLHPGQPTPPFLHPVPIAPCPTPPTSQEDSTTQTPVERIPFLEDLASLMVKKDEKKKSPPKKVRKPVNMVVEAAPTYRFNAQILDQKLKALYSHKSGYFICSICQSLFRVKNLLSNHLVEHLEIPYQCCKCGTHTKSYDTAFIHALKFHNMERINIVYSEVLNEKIATLASSLKSAKANVSPSAREAFSKRVNVLRKHKTFQTGSKTKSKANKSTKQSASASKSSSSKGNAAEDEMNRIFRTISADNGEKMAFLQEEETNSALMRMFKRTEDFNLCRICEVPFTRSAVAAVVFKEHALTTHLNYEPYKCSNCDFSAYSQKSFSVHCRTRHAGSDIVVKHQSVGLLVDAVFKEYDIEDTPNLPDSPPLETGDGSTAKKNLSYSCDLCVFECDDPFRLLRHKKLAHNKSSNTARKSTTPCTANVRAMLKAGMPNTARKSTTPCTANVREMLKAGLPNKQCARKSTVNRPKKTPKKTFAANNSQQPSSSVATNTEYTDSNGQKFVCQKCDFVTEKRKRAMIYHFKKHGFECFVECNHCYAKYTSLRLLLKHFDLIHRGREMHPRYLPIETYFVPITPTEIAALKANKKTAKMSNDAVKQSLSLPLFKCVFCNLEEVNGDYMRYHLNIHLDYKPFKCKKCSMTFSDPFQQNLHLSEDHSPELCQGMYEAMKLYESKVTEILEDCKRANRISQTFKSWNLEAVQNKLLEDLMDPINWDIQKDKEPDSAPAPISAEAEAELEEEDKPDLLQCLINLSSGSAFKPTSKNTSSSDSGEGSDYHPMPVTPHKASSKRKTISLSDYASMRRSSQESNNEMTPVVKKVKTEAVEEESDTAPAAASPKKKLIESVFGVHSKEVKKPKKRPIVSDRSEGPESKVPKYTADFDDKVILCYYCSFTSCSITDVITHTRAEHIGGRSRQGVVGLLWIDTITGGTYDFEGHIFSNGFDMDVVIDYPYLCGTCNYRAVDIEDIHEHENFNHLELKSSAVLGIKKSKASSSGRGRSAVSYDQTVRRRSAPVKKKQVRKSSKATATSSATSSIKSSQETTSSKTAPSSETSSVAGSDFLNTSQSSMESAATSLNTSTISSDVPASVLSEAETKPNVADLMEIASETDIKPNVTNMFVKYKCSHCPMVSQSEYKFRLHLASHDGFKCLEPDLSQNSHMKSLKCKVCSYRAPNSVKFTNHMICHNGPAVKFICGYCGCQAESTQAIKRHHHKLHENQSFDITKFVDKKRVYKNLSLLVDLDPRVKLENVMKMSNERFKFVLNEGNVDSGS